MAVLVIAIILLFDQIVKIWVKTNMCIGETAVQWEALNITWFRMTFLENNGAAGGLQLFGSKVFLTLFRLIAIGFVGYYMWKITKREEAVRKGFFFYISALYYFDYGQIEFLSKFPVTGIVCRNSHNSSRSV